MKRIVSILLVLLFVVAASLPAFAATTEESTVIVNSGTASDMGYYFNSSGGRVWAENYSVGTTGAIYVADYSYLLITCGAQTSAWMNLVLYTENMTQTRVLNFNATSNYRINLSADEVYMKTSVIRSSNDPTITGVKVTEIVDPTPGGTVTAEPRPLLETPLSDLEVTEGLLLLIVCVLLISLIVRAFAK